MSQMSEIVPSFRAARRVSVPLIALATPDPASTLETLRLAVEDSPPPLLQWDVIRGLTPMNPPAQVALSRLGSDLAEATQNPVEALVVATKLPPRSVLFLHNAHRYLEQPAVVQAIWNLRDPFKADGRTLVLLCPGMTLPAELSQDILLLEESLPGWEELRTILLAQYACAKEAAPDLPPLEEWEIEKAVDAVLGLAAFSAEQAIALSLSRKGLDLHALWERKRQMIEVTPGLTVWRGEETFENIGGVENAKGFLTRLLNGREPPRAVVFVDEIEKALAGSGSAGGDSSGVSQSFLGTLLSFMQNRNAKGCLFLGPPGAAKSAMAKACGNTAGIPTLSFDLGGMKSSLVGESEMRLRQALGVVDAISQGRALFLATCNSVLSLAPELRRRFETTLFFDLPNAEERAVIWNLYLTHYGLEEKGDALPDATDWTGAEIKGCCDLAYRLDLSLVEAAQYLVPVSRSAPEAIESLRAGAQGRFLSASYSGVYDRERGTESKRGRTFGVE